MSAGPIKAERDAWKRDQVSTPDAHRVCMGVGGKRGYCGRRSAVAVQVWGQVSCADCVAAARADGVNV